MSAALIGHGWVKSHWRHDLMATFEGSFQEFHDHLGPRIRNLVNGFARKGRNARNGVCEECQKTGQELDSAHVHGRDRRTIIETVLFRYLSGGVVRCIIKEAESEILAEHGDIREAFKFLCKECHVEYDRRQPQQKPIEGPAPLQTPSTRLEVQFFPDNEKLFKDLLIARKKAYV